VIDRPLRIGSSPKMLFVMLAMFWDLMRNLYLAFQVILDLFHRLDRV